LHVRRWCRPLSRLRCLRSTNALAVVTRTLSVYAKRGMQDLGEGRPRWSRRRSGVSELPDMEGLIQKAQGAPYTSSTKSEDCLGAGQEWHGMAAGWSCRATGGERTAGVARTAPNRPTGEEESTGFVSQSMKAISRA